MKTTTTIILLILSLNLLAQSGIENRELVVEKEYSNEIYEVNPIFDYASIYTPQRSSVHFGQDTLIRTSAFTPDINVFIRPVSYNTQTHMQGHKGFVKLDKGTLNPLHGQAGYSYSAQNYFNINGSFNYDHRKNNEVNNQFIKALNGKLGMEYYLTNELKSEINIKYSNNQFGLYGSNDLLTATEIDNTTGRNVFGVDLGLSTFRASPDKWNFNINSNFSQWSNYLSDDKERNIRLKGGVEFNFDKTWGLSFKPNYDISSSTTLGSNNVINGSFQIAHNSTNFYSQTGIIANYFDNNVNLWPHVDLRWNLSSDAALNLRSSATSTILGAEATTQINPYTDIDPLINQDKHISLQNSINLDINATLAGGVDFKFQLGYVNAKGDLNFSNSPIDLRKFQFERVDYQVMSIAFDIRKEIFAPHLTAGLIVQYNNYANFTTELYNRPMLVVTPKVEGSIFNGKLTYRVAALINNPQQFDRIPTLTTHSEWRKNLSGSISYSILDQLNLNLNVDNILDDSYQVWKGYNNFGRNISGGLLFKF